MVRRRLVAWEDAAGNKMWLGCRVLSCYLVSWQLIFFLIICLISKHKTHQKREEELQEKIDLLTETYTVLSFLQLNPFHSQHTFAYCLLQNICFISTCSYLALCACVWTAVMLHLAGGTGTKQNLKNCLPFSYCDNLRTVWLLLKLSVWCKQLTDVLPGLWLLSLGITVGTGTSGNRRGTCTLA